MSEKPFYITDTGLGLDTVSDEMYSFGDEEDFCRLFDKLNEQQSTISQLKEENVQLQKEKINMEYAEQIVEENQKLRIAKNDLRIENEQLRKDVENLQEVVAELGATLLMHGFEIEINDENLSEMIDNG